MSNYPQVGSEVIAWKEGVTKAQRTAGLLEWHHMITWENESSNDDDHDSKPHWFYQPFHHPGNMFGDKSDDAPCASDND